MAGIIIGAIIVVAISFFAGMKYGEGAQSNTRSTMAAFNGRAGQFGGIGGQRGSRANGGFVSGSILSKDSNSIVIKDNAGGSKIVFLTSSTTVMKTSAGSLADLSTGTQVVATGNPNSDGSINAESIQIRPLSGTGAIPAR